MKKNLQQFFFGSTFTSNHYAQGAWLLFRIHIGLSMAIGAGWGKVEHGLPPEWFVKQVGDLGFTFISPTFWAAVSGWGEFLGGICIALGFFTRFSALQLSFQFFVISFIWYNNPEPVIGMNFQQLYFWCYIVVAAMGSGKFSIDYYITKAFAQKQKLALAPKTLVLFILTLILGLQANAQMSNNDLSNIKDYDKVAIKNINGTVSIVLGKPFSISIQGSNNAAKDVKVSKQKDVLRIEIIKQNDTNWWRNNKVVNVTINMPEISKLYNQSNADVKVTGFEGRYLGIDNNGNGNITLQGSIVDFIEVENTGNGDCNLKQITTSKAQLVKAGNGDIILNTNNNFTVTMSGNGDIVNYGSGKAIVAKQSGNGKVVYKNETSYKKDTKFSLQDLAVKGVFGKENLSIKTITTTKKIALTQPLNLL